jgi:hypothetical protein
MDEMARVAGFFAAHGIWSVSDGETLTPILAHVQPDGTQGMTRLAYDDLGDAARAGQNALKQGRPDWARAALVVDAYLNLDTGRFDALIVDAVEYLPTRTTLKMAIPYRPHSQGFAVYRPKFIEVNGTDDYAALAEHFFAGVDSHDQAAAVWNAHLIDESV